MNALLIVGSGKPRFSNSEALGLYLVKRLTGLGVATEVVRTRQALKKHADPAAFLETVERADLLVLTFPLFVDSLPAQVTRALELIAARRRANPAPKPQQFAALVNCGFPEAVHNETALAICKQFAKETGIAWAGGLALGGGEALGGRPLEALGFFTRRPRKALDLAAAALAEGRPVPEEAAALMAKPLMPSSLYNWLARRQWRKRARKNGALDLLDARPYPDETTRGNE